MTDVTPRFKSEGFEIPSPPKCREYTRTRHRPRPAEHLHHRKLRKQGGPDTPDNLLACCSDCHSWIHAHPAVSYVMGLLIRGSDPDPTSPYRREAP
jgi:hypothetical protein